MPSSGNHLSFFFSTEGDVAGMIGDKLRYGISVDGACRTIFCLRTRHGLGTEDLRYPVAVIQTGHSTTR